MSILYMCSTDRISLFSGYRQGSPTNWKRTNSNPKPKPRGELRWFLQIFLRNRQWNSSIWRGSSEKRWKSRHRSWRSPRASSIHSSWWFPNCPPIHRQRERIPASRSSSSNPTTNPRSHSQIFGVQREEPRPRREQISIDSFDRGIVIINNLFLAPRTSKCHCNIISY